MTTPKTALLPYIISLPVKFYPDFSPFQISVMNQFIHINRYQICLDSTKLYNICSIFVLWIIFQKHQYIHRSLRDASLLTQRTAHLVIEFQQFVYIFYTYHFVFFLSYVFELFIFRMFIFEVF